MPKETAGGKVDDPNYAVGCFDQTETKCGDPRVKAIDYECNLPWKFLPGLKEST